MEKKIDLRYYSIIYDLINDVKSGVINIIYNNNELSEVNCSYEIDSKYSL